MYVQERIRPLESMGFGVSGRLGRPGGPAQASISQRAAPTQQPGASLMIGRIISIDGAGIQASPTEMRASLTTLACDRPFPDHCASAGHYLFPWSP